jgi:hypothetical protein
MGAPIPPLMSMISWRILSGGNELPGGVEADELTADLLRDQLLSLPGVESAVIEGDALTPEGVRVRLAAGVDATAVGEAVQRVLAAHGLRSEMARPGDAITVELDTTPSPSEPAVRIERRETLATVSVVEGRGGITVRAETTTGRSVDRPAAATGRRLEEAVVGAVSELAGATPAPVLLAIEDRDVEGTLVVTVVVDDGRHRHAGSSVVESGRPFAVAQATWTALRA